MTAGIPQILRKTGARRAPLQHAPPQFFLALLLVLSSLLSAAIARQARPQVWLGIGITAEKDILAIEGTTAKSGLRITRLSFNSPADKAGLHGGDVITNIDGEPATKYALWQIQLIFKDASRKHRVTITRAGETLTKTIKPRPLA